MYDVVLSIAINISKLHSEIIIVSSHIHNSTVTITTWAQEAITSEVSHRQKFKAGSHFSLYGLKMLAVGHLGKQQLQCYNVITWRDHLAAHLNHFELANSLRLGSKIVYNILQRIHTVCGLWSYK